MLSRYARAWLDGPPQAASTPRAAATVMLLRDVPVPGSGLQVFVIRRAGSMAFAAQMTAFPGGGVDPRDADPDLPWAGPSPARWARLMDTDEASARRLVVAAAREVFEECGVLLAGPDADSVLREVNDGTWRRVRGRLVAHEASFAQLLAARGLVLRTDLLALRGHWITPRFEPRRYDTRFFAALLPAGQDADDQTSEADQAQWAAPVDLLAEYAAGTVQLLPPTLVMLEDLALAGSAAAYLARPPWLAAVEPELVRLDGGVAIRCELPR